MRLKRINELIHLLWTTGEVHSKLTQRLIVELFFNDRL